MFSKRDFLVGAGLTTLLPLPAQSAQAVTRQVSALQRLTLEGRYIPRWLELTQDTAVLRQGFARQMPGLSDDELDSVALDAKEQFAAFLGDERVALGSSAAEVVAPPPGEFTEALGTIRDLAASRRVVILNESHAASRHRAFLEHLLRTLRADGFTHLAAETFFAENLPMRSSEPIGARHGYYLRDPVFAEAVRVALLLGYKLTAYEQPAHLRSTAALSAEVARSREDSQAANLARLLQDDPAARVLVYVGYGHLREDRDTTMASRLTALTGVDPLTIEQARTGSFGPSFRDDWRAPAGSSDIHFALPGSSIAPGYADLSVYHRSLPVSDGRPGWLAALPGRMPVRLALPRLPEGLALAQAVHAQDPEPSVPADQFLITPNQRRATFFLRPGRYRFRIERENGFHHVQFFEAEGTG